MIESGVLQQYGVRHISMGGHPSGDPNIPADALIPALQKKAAALAQLGVPGTIITQVDFDVDRVLQWVAEVREPGVDLPVRVGVPGPASVKLLLGFASRLGISTSATIAKKYGLSVTNLLGKAGPENFIRDLQAGSTRRKHGVVKLHFYTFGGFKTTAEWIASTSRTSNRPPSPADQNRTDPERGRMTPGPERILLGLARWPPAP